MAAANNNRRFITYPEKTRQQAGVFQRAKNNQSSSKRSRSRPDRRAHRSLSHYVSRAYFWRARWLDCIAAAQYESSAGDLRAAEGGHAGEQPDSGKHSEIAACEDADVRAFD